MKTAAQIQAEECLWRVADVAVYLQCSRSWVYQAAERGALPCLRVGAMLRFDPEEVRRFARGESAKMTDHGLPLYTPTGTLP